MKTVIRFAILATGIFSVGTIGAVSALAATQEPAGEQQSIATLDSEPGSSLSSYFATFAGSNANAQDLIGGLRSGSSIILAGGSGEPSVTFTPPTATMGYGEVAISLGLAQQLLASYGITDPTPQEIEAALMGGTITTSNGGTQSLNGVLTMRSSGMGWGEIARKDGVNLGSIVSQIHDAGDQGMGESHTPEAETENSDTSGVDAGHENADTIDASAVNHSDNADLPPNVVRPDVDVERPEIERPDIVRPDIERPDLPGIDH